MSNLLQLQQTIVDVQDRINREIQFGEDSHRELVGTIGLLRETIQHLETQITRLFNERSASLSAALGQPGKAQTVNITASPQMVEALSLGVGIKTTMLGDADE
jgi:hypothetical protein